MAASLGHPTTSMPASGFYRTEDYHQQYLAKRGAKSCHM